MDGGGVKKDFYDDFDLTNINQNYLDNLFARAENPEMEQEVYKSVPAKINYIRLSRIVALVAIVVIASTGIAVYTVQQNANADKALAKQNAVIESGNDKLAMGQNAGADEENAGIQTATASDWDVVLSLVEDNEGVEIPGNIPEEFKFEKFKLENNPNGSVFTEFKYANDMDKEICIKQFNLRGTESSEKMASYFSKKLIVDNTEIFISEATEENSLSMVFYKDDSKININGDISEEDMIKIVEGYL